MAKYTGWYHLSQFSKSKSGHFDLMIGVQKMKSAPNYLDDNRKTKMFETIIWDAKNHLSMGYNDYRRIVDNNETEGLEKLKKLDIPLDVKM